MLVAVGHILRTEGHRALIPRKVIRVSGLSPKGQWIKRCFGSMDKLLAEYLMQTDFWMRLGDMLGEIGEADLRNRDCVKALVIQVLHAQLDFFFGSHEMQELLMWGISRPGSVLKRRFSEARERSAETLLDAAEKLLGAPGSPFAPLAAFLVMASYLLPIHAIENESTFNGLDLATEAGRQELYDAVAYLIDGLPDS